MFLTTALIGALCTTAVALNPACAPGGNFDLSIWELQLPTGNPGQPTTISDTSLEGCSGFQDQFFYTDSTDGALVMQVPGSPSSSGCVTTAHSQHCRTELREILPISWDPNGPVNRMTAVLAVIVADESVHGTVIGQVHIDDSLSTKPVAELYYNATGFISMGVEQNRTGGNQILTPVGQVMPGQTFSYEIRYESNVLSVSINSGPFTVLSTYQLDAPLSYFKAGNYNQGNSRSEVHFFSISATHDSSLTKTTTPTNTATNFFPPAIWNQPTPTVGCQGSPPCTLILPPSPLPTPIEITWIFSTATLVSSNGSTYTGLTDITLPPFTISSVSFWPVTIASSMTGSVIFYPSQSVMPPSTVITLPGTETLVPVPSGTYPAFYSPTARPPPSPVPTGTISSCSMWYQSQTNDTCDSIADLYLLTVPDFTSWNPSVMTDCSGLVTGDYYCVALGSNSTVIPTWLTTPSFKSTSQTITVQPQATSSIDVPPIIPVVIAPPIPVPPIVPPCVFGCGSVDCALFGCGGGCGLFGCDGGCGTGFCGGGCGPGGCGPGCGPGNCAVQGGGGGSYPPPPGPPPPIDIPAVIACDLIPTPTYPPDISFSTGGSISIPSTGISYPTNSPIPTPESTTTTSTSTSSSASGTATPPCTFVAPSIYDDYTVTLDLFADTGCCASVQTIHMGTLDECHDATQPFNGFAQAVGQTMFGQDIKILTYSGTGCTNTTFNTYDLTNYGSCSSSDNPWDSFKIASVVSTTTTTTASSTQTTAPPTCTFTQPAIADDYTVTLDLFSDEGCCTSVETINMGTLNKCHTANQVFQGFTQAVGQNMFGQGIHIQVFTSSDCTGSVFNSYSLTNIPNCFVGGNQWLSFQIVSSIPPTSTQTATSTCLVTQPTPIASNIITIDLFSDSQCCDAPFEVLNIGTLGVCHTSNQPFQGLTQGVGSSLFGQNNNIQLYTDTQCTSLGTRLDLTNYGGCFASGDTYGSFMVHNPSSAPPSSTSTSGSTSTSTCGPLQPDNPSENTITLNLYPHKAECCNAFETITIGKMGVCHKGVQGIGSVTQTVGDNLFGQNIRVQFYQDDNCQDSDFGVLKLSNHEVCYSGSGWNSFQMVQPTPPAPPAPKCAVVPSMGGSNTVTLSLSSDGGCCDVVETITLGVVNECHKADSGFSSFMQAVGDGMFHQDIQIEIFTDSSCTYGGRAADLSNRAICDTAGSTTFHSFRLSESGGSGDPSSPPSGGSSGGGGGGGGGSSSPDTHGCVVGHCYMQNDPVGGDTMTVQIYWGSGQYSEEYIFLLQNGQYWASSDTLWQWNGVRDPHGVYWNFQIEGNCGAMQYTNSAQNPGGTIYVGHSIQSNVFQCNEVFDHEVYCLEYEASYWGPGCVNYQNPPWCDFRSYCSPWRGGNPTIVYG